MKKKLLLGKKFILLTLLSISACATPVSWTEPTVMDAFMKNCNPENDEKMKTICTCALDKIKAKYPDAAKADTIPKSEIEKFATECVK